MDVTDIISRRQSSTIFLSLILHWLPVIKKCTKSYSSLKSKSWHCHHPVEHNLSAVTNHAEVRSVNGLVHSLLASALAEFPGLKTQTGKLHPSVHRLYSFPPQNNIPVASSTHEVHREGAHWGRIAEGVSPGRGGSDDQGAPVTVREQEVVHAPENQEVLRRRGKDNATERIPQGLCTNESPSSCLYSSTEN